MRNQALVALVESLQDVFPAWHKVIIVVKNELVLETNFVIVLP